MRPIHINAPVGTIVNPVLPAACGARGVIGYRVFDAVMGALAQVVPENVIAPGEGGPTLISIGGYQDGKPVRAHRGAGRRWGARATRDGLEGVSNPLANLSNQPVEMIEASCRCGCTATAGARLGRPGRVPRRSRLRALIRAAGRRGRADGALRPALAPAVRDRGWGSGSAVVEHDRRSSSPDHADGSPELRRGDVFHHVSAGGGGSGFPLARDPALVLEDVLDGKVSVEAARERYGVVIEDGKATRA